MAQVPQPHPDRLTPFGGHPAVVGVVPGQPDLVALTAVAWARAAGGTLVFAYADPMRHVVAELPDGSVRHADVDPDVGDDVWQRRSDDLTAHLHRLVDPTGVVWEFRYLAGRADRALTHLARAIDAAVVVVGNSPHHRSGGLRGLLEGSVAAHLAHHQHRPVLVVPLDVVDWSDPIA